MQTYSWLRNKQRFGSSSQGSCFINIFKWDYLILIFVIVFTFFIIFLVGLSRVEGRGERVGGEGRRGFRFAVVLALRAAARSASRVAARSASLAANASRSSSASRMAAASLSAAI